MPDENDSGSEDGFDESGYWTCSKDDYKRGDKRLIAMACGLCLMGVTYAGRELIRRERIKANLEADAPFLGAATDVEYRDIDGNGKLETIKIFDLPGQQFRFKVIERNGSYELVKFE